MKAVCSSALLIVLTLLPVQAQDVLDACLEPYQPLLVIAVFPTENDIAGTSYQAATGETVQAYENLLTGEAWLIVNSDWIDCPPFVFQGDLPTITLYPLNGERFTWSVQDDFDHWHIVRLLTGETAQTTVEYDDSGRAFTRLVVRRNQPLDASRYHIFDENGNIAG